MVCENRLNSGSRNLIAITLGIGFGLIALTILSGGYATTNLSSDQSIRAGVGMAAAPAATFATTNNFNPSSANTGNPVAYPFTVILLAAISLVIAFGASLGISRKMNTSKVD